jgi:kynureninase
MNPTSFEYTLDFARSIDAQDPLHHFRDQFYIPLINGKPSIYLTGNSLGLQPRNTQDYVLTELEDWANFGVEGHFHAKNPWYSYHEMFPELLTGLTGALPHELVVMNQLTVNLHLLMMSFYRPTPTRYKIICEAKAFPSDQYAFQSQALLHGLNPDEAIVEVHPRPGTAYIEPDDILEAIRKHGNETALVIFSGVNYYSGQVFPMQAITEAAHSVGAHCGFDLAHAAGNIRLQLHDWNVDFACWCTYKYLNSGPGGVSGAFVHERHAQNTDLFRLAGWWGHDKETRFKMEKTFLPIPTAEGWQMSNAPVLSMSAHRASLDVFAEAGTDKLFEKGLLLSGYLMFVLDRINAGLAEPSIEIITPRNDNERGCQVSMRIVRNGKAVFEALLNAGVIADWREPDVIRVAPVPLYNTFEDVFHFGKIIEHQLLANA